MIPPSLAKTNALYFAPDGQPAPDALRRWMSALGIAVEVLGDGDHLMALALRGRPRYVAFDARRRAEATFIALRRLKSDSYTGVVPCVALTAEDDSAFDAAFHAGA